ncbi:MAG: hypothetical protein Alpg2KO_22300 [Alphaproteobacteria bacterium]
MAASIMTAKSAQTLGREEVLLPAPAERALREKLMQAQLLPGTVPDPAEAQDNAPDWLDRAGEGTLQVSLAEAVQIAAANATSIRDQREQVFTAALNLDLERDAFRSSFTGLVQSDAVTELLGGDREAGTVSGAEISASRLFANGLEITARLGLDLALLLTAPEAAALGLFADGSILLPLMRGSGEAVVTEPLKQADRNLIYAFYDWERFKRSFAVAVVRDALAVITARDAVRTRTSNLEGLERQSIRAARLADLGRLPGIQAEEARQNELRARDRLLTARTRLAAAEDTFRQRLGLPPDAQVTVSDDVLGNLRRLYAGDVARFEWPEDQAIRLALDHRLDLRRARGEVEDALRGIMIAEDQLKSDLDLVGSVSAGGARSNLSSALNASAPLRLQDAEARLGLRFQPGFERTAERNSYRQALITAEAEARQVADLEDTIKAEIRSALRDLSEARQRVAIQRRSVELAARRVAATELLLDLGRAQIRDILDARDDLVSAEEALTQALIDHRLTELEFQRDLGLLRVTPDGLWQELPAEAAPVITAPNEDS